MPFEDYKYFVKKISPNKSCTGVFRNTQNGMVRVARKNSEVDILKMINHPNCVRLSEVVREDDGSVLLLFEFATAFMVPIGRFSYQFVVEGLYDPLSLAKDISAALQYIHGLYIVHRDVKPDNVLFDRAAGRFLLGDFGSAVVLSPSDQGYLAESPATVAFFPPEVCAIDATPKNNGFSADLWALGLTVYCCVFQKLPFNITTDSYVDLVDEIALYANPIGIINHASDDRVRKVLTRLLCERQYLENPHRETSH